MKTLAIAALMLCIAATISTNVNAEKKKDPPKCHYDPWGCGFNPTDCCVPDLHAELRDWRLY